MEASSKPYALIIGGTSGLGLELGLALTQTHKVVVTGRHDPRQELLNFQYLDISPRSYFLGTDIDNLVQKYPQLNLLVYAAGFYQEGTISDLSDPDIAGMINVGLLAPILLLQRFLSKQSQLPGFIAVTSTSQWTPRLLEPVYTAVKAGLGMLANSVSLDERVGKVLVIGPAGMRTRFWDQNPRDMSTMLDPKLVAEQILNLYEGNFKYKFARILREPARIEVVETR